MFGDLTTVNFGYTQGWDVVGKVDKGIVQPFRADANRRNYAVGLSQVLTRNTAAGPELRDRRERRLSAQSLPLGALHRPDGGARLQLRARALSGHPHQQRRLGAAQILPAVSTRRWTAAIASTPIPGASWPTPCELGYTQPRLHQLDLRRHRCATTGRRTRPSIATCFRTRTRRTSWPATASWRSSTASRWSWARATNSTPAGRTGSRRAR